MMDVELSSQAVKFLKTHPELSFRIKQRLHLLGNVPFPSDCKRIQNVKEKMYRIRLGRIRIIYMVSETVQLLRIDKRSRVYK